ncbi:MAG TPA: hypothetical protein VH253_09090 [Phycisphaerae bacterium]|nr:hypothetical protein [Phycisphaerae bacterium]
MSTPAPPTPLRLDVPPLRSGPMLFILPLFGLTFTALGWGLLIAALRAAIPPNALLVYLLFAIPFSIIGPIFLVCTAAMLLRRHTLAADPTGITITSHLLGFSRTRRFDTPALRDIVLLVHPGSTDGASSADILASLDTGERILLIRRYGAQATTRLANALRAALFPDHPHASEFPLDAPTPPPGGYLTARIAGDTLHLRLASEPASQVGTDLLPNARFAIIFPPFFCLIVIAIVLQHGVDLTAFLYIALALFITASLTITSAATIRRTRRSAGQQADIACTPTTLSIDLTGPAPAHFAWHVANIRSVLVAPSWSRISNHPIFELQIASDGAADPTSLFTGRDEDDLEWLAITLCTTLGLPTPASRRAALLQNPALTTQTSALSTQNSGLLPAIDAAIKNSRVRRLPTATGLRLQLHNATSLRDFFADLLGSISIGNFRIATARGSDPFTDFAFALICILLPIFILRSDLTLQNILGSTLFILVAIFLLSRAYAQATASATFDLTPDTLHIHSKTLRSHHADLPASHILAVRATSERSEIHLTLDLHAAAPYTCCHNFPPADLHALAHALTLALGLQAPPPGSH